MSSGTQPRCFGTPGVCSCALTTGAVPCAAHAVVGGLHLVSPPCEARVPATAKAMAEADPDLVLAGGQTSDALQ